MKRLLNSVLNLLGIRIQATSGPLTDDEWDRERVLPIYMESLNEGKDDDILDPEQIQAFMRGEIAFSEVKSR